MKNIVSLVHSCWFSHILTCVVSHSFRVLQVESDVATSNMADFITNTFIIHHLPQSAYTIFINYAYQLNIRARHGRQHDYIIFEFLI